MTTSPCTSRRGAALLVVLATLVLAATASAALLRLATTEHARRTLDHRAAIADDLLTALDDPIEHWLHEESGQVVLSPEAPTPGVAVVEDSWELDGRTCAIRVTGFDQCGMVPLTVARSGSPLRLALPSDTKRLLDAVTIKRGSRPGLDLYLSPRAREPGLAVFPPAGVTEPDDAPAPAFGSLVATHPPRMINVLTAPLPLVEAAMRLAGRGDLDQVLEARERGEQPELAAPPRRSSRRSIPRIVTVSPVWSMRIDIQVGHALRSWWATYERAGSNWRCVQRLAITE